MEMRTFCSLMQRTEILHKDQYKAYILQVLHVGMSKSELHTVDELIGATSSYHTLFAL